MATKRTTSRAVQSAPGAARAAATPGRPSRWKSVPISDRVVQRRQLLLDAALEILGTEGWSGLTVRSLIERADLNVRYFYESFTDLDELVIAVYDGVLGEMGEVILDALGEVPPGSAAQVGAVVRAVVDFVEGDRRRGRVLYAEGLGSEALNRRRLQSGEALVSFIEQYATETLGQPPPGELIGRVGASIVVGGFGQLLRDWLSDRIPVSKDQFVLDATEILLAIGDTAGAIALRRAPRGRRRSG